MMQQLLEDRTRGHWFLVQGEELVNFRMHERQVASMWREKEAFYLENRHIHAMIDSPRWLLRRLFDVVREGWKVRRRPR